MAWMREECSASDAELLERLVGRLEMCLKAFPRSGVTAVLYDDDVVTVWDEGGMTVAATGITLGFVSVAFKVFVIQGTSALALTGQRTSTPIPIKNKAAARRAAVVIFVFMYVLL